MKNKFNASIYKKENEKKQLEKEANETKNLLSFFLRNYKQELSRFYTQKEELFLKKKELFKNLSEIKESLYKAFDDKNKAYDELNYCKNRINSWYAHHLFGQEIINSDKQDRDYAFEDVCAAKKLIDNLKYNQRELHYEIGNVKEKIREVFTQINQVKKDRSKMYKLKKLGYQRRELKAKFDKLCLAIDIMTTEIQKIIISKKDYINQENRKHGVFYLEAMIRKIKNKKRNF